MVFTDNTLGNYSVANVQDGTSITDLATLTSLIKVYPNPAQDQLFVESPVALKAVLTGIDGRTIATIENVVKIDVSNYAKGVYFLTLIDKENRSVRIEKIVKM